VPSGKPRIFLTYSHEDNETGDFDWVVEELTRTSVDVEYDEVVLIPGRKLWPQIEKRILAPGLHGWGILLTVNSLKSPACMEELEYARLRALNQRGEEFPLIGLVDRVPEQEIPLAIRTRLYIDFADPDWTERVRAGLERRPPRRAPGATPRFRWAVHRCYGGDPELIAIEVGPRFGSIPYFGLISPMPGATDAGIGGAGGGGVGSATFDFMESKDLEIQGEKCWAVSMKGSLDPATSAYAIFQGYLPRWVMFGPCPGPFTLPTSGEKYDL